MENLCKKYKGKPHAVNNVSFNVSAGECVGLLGANGAGKSTIFSMLSGQLYPNHGSIEMYDSKRISYCPQTNPVDQLLTVQENIYFYGRLRNVENLEQLATQTLQQFALTQYRNVLVKNLSGGNKRKMSVAVTCFGTAVLVLLDEPTSDMDPIARTLVYQSIHRLLGEHKAVVLTSHTITEIDRVCQRIAILRYGEIISMGPPSALKQMHGNAYLVTLFYNKANPQIVEEVIFHWISVCYELPAIIRVYDYRKLKSAFRN